MKCLFRAHALLLSASLLLASAMVPGGYAAQAAEVPTAIAPPSSELMRPVSEAPTAAYVIVPNDTLSIKVFQEPDLSTDDMLVDNNGNVQIPLVGEVPAAGRTPQDLAADIAARLGQRYIVNPQVAISIAKPAQRFVTVEGQVNKPGVYEIGREYTLLSAIARAESPTKVARLDEVMVYRTVNGQRMGARFDLREVRSGRVPDPAITGGDVVVVGYSSTKGAWRDFLQATPLMNVFFLF